jgi:hypothetical protein
MYSTSRLIVESFIYIDAFKLSRFEAFAGGEQNFLYIGLKYTLLSRLRARRFRPSAANSFLKRLRKLMGFTISNGWITADPMLRMTGYKAGEVHPWTDAEIGVFDAHWALGSKQRSAVGLHVFDGQRRSDVYRITWADYGGEMISVTRRRAPSSTLPLIPTAIMSDRYEPSLACRLM